MSMNKQFNVSQFLICLVVSPFVCLAQPIPTDSLFLGQTPPGNTPQIFHLPVTPGFFSAERVVVSNDGKTIFYQELDGYKEGAQTRIRCMTFANGKWNGPVNMFEGYGAVGMSISGDTLFIQKEINETWISVKTLAGWSAPERILSKFSITHYLQETNKGNYYISSKAVNGMGGLDFCKIQINGTDTTVTSLGEPFNSANDDYDFYVANDESYIIFSTNTKGGFGGKDLFISFRQGDGSWGTPENLGPTVNASAWEWGTYVTNDNKYLFFTRGTNDSDTHIYWVRIDELINELKK